MLIKFLNIISKLLIRLINILIIHYYLLKQCLNNITLIFIKIKLLIFKENSQKMSFYKFRPFEIKKVIYNHKRKSKQIPEPRSGHRIVCNDKDIYCFGGFNPDIERRNNFLFHEFWKFNRHTRKWTLLINSESNMPRELASNAVLLENEMLMIFGGTGYPFGEKNSNDLHICYLNRLPLIMSKLVTSGRKPEPQYGQQIIYHDNYLYSIGGTTGYLYFCDIHRLNLSSKVWNSVYNSQDNVGQDPKGRYRHEIAYDGTFIYVLGGGTALQAYELSVIPTFDIKNNKWITTKTKPDTLAIEHNNGYPNARKCHSCVQYKTEYNDIEIVISGGYDDLIHYNDIWKLSLRTLKWSLFKKAILPKPLFFHDSCTSGDGEMYIFGGIVVGEGNHTRVNSMYKMWVTIPKLKTICWEAVLHYYPDIQNVEKTKLLEIGVPLKYVNSLEP